MKHVAAALLALTISSGTIANAGNLTPPIIDQNIIVDDAIAGSSSSPMILVALTALIMIAVTAQ